MAKIRHLAIKTEDTEALALFYREVFELKEVHRNRGQGGAIMLSDGYFSLAILPNQDQNCRNGLYHFGFHIDDLDKTIEKIKKLGISKLPKPRPKDREYAETRASDPDGNYFDLSVHGFLDVNPTIEKKRD
jgi:predicted enzyme related to lactoylglutathione lyase